ncbi:MAG TPA: trypsin-like peptidase domain-containing protein [Albitalea sp.]|nr:trypsin-like peptidase domain-containing protein [Albitalea sp.]
MKKAPLYSHSRRSAIGQEPASPMPEPATGPTAPDTPAPEPHPPGRLSRFFKRARRPLWVVAALALFGLGGFAQHLLIDVPPALTQKDIDVAVRHSLEHEPAPSPYARAYAMVRPSVVRVIGLSDDKDDEVKPSDDPRSHTRSTGTGVVIVDNGTILTNLHVVVGARRIKVTFFDGHESEAAMVGAQPENDLAVLRASSIPDDLVAATMRGTGDLLPGDEVLAVGFPFGIGPSASGGVVSGLKRQFRAPEGARLTNLIQFDAAANPGNSGGPLVTMDGSVVGIVTAILNPGDQGTFIGIGFAVPIENAAAAVGMPPF